MQVTKTNIPDVLILEPKEFKDERGFFSVTYNKEIFDEIVKNDVRFVQDNFSHSKNNVLRGLHYQIKQPQGKLVKVTRGEIYDVSVDIRKSSPTCGQWVGVNLTSENNKQVWIPPGFAHGFLVLSDSADVAYKTTDYYAPEHERCIRWDDPTLDIDWPLDGLPFVSEKDAEGVLFLNADVFD